MILTLERFAPRESYTIGHLYINGTYFCDTCEDKVRDYDKDGELDECKICGETAIPYGRYKITLDIQSPRFSKKKAYKFCDGYLPRLLEVPNFEGVLIHIGNSACDSEGCILVGENKEKGKVLNSTATFKRLYKALETADDNGEKLWIEIV